MFLSQLYLEARVLSEGSMIPPPRRRRTRWRVDSYHRRQHPSIQSSIVHHVYPSPNISSINQSSNPNPYLIPENTPFGDQETNLLDVIIAQSPTILELLSGENQPLLIRRNTLLILDLGLDVVDGIARLDVEGNGLTREGFDEAVQTVSIVCILCVVGMGCGCCRGGCGVGSRDLHLHCTEEKKLACHLFGGVD